MISKNRIAEILEAVQGGVISYKLRKDTLDPVTDYRTGNGHMGFKEDLSDADPEDIVLELYVTELCNDHNSPDYEFSLDELMKGQIEVEDPSLLTLRDGAITLQFAESETKVFPINVQ